MNGRKLMTLLAELDLGTEASRSASVEHLFDTPLASGLKGVTKLVNADNLVELDERRSWLRMRKKGDVLDEARCDVLLELRREDTIGEVSDEDIAYLEDQLHQLEEMEESLDAQIALLDASVAQMDDEDVDLTDSGLDFGDEIILTELDDVAATFARISSAARGTEETVSSSTALPLVDARRYLEVEDQFCSGLTTLSKRLLTSRMSLLNSVFNPPKDGSNERSGDELKMKDRYRASSKKLIMAKLDHKILETLQNSKTSEAHAANVSADQELGTMIGKLKGALDSASDAFVSNKDGSDLDLQLARLNYFVDAKHRILHHLLEQWCRQIVFRDLRDADELLHEELSQFLMEIKDFIRRLAPEKATIQRSLEVASAFANAPDSNHHSSHFSYALDAMKQLVVGQLPPLIPASPRLIDGGNSEPLGSEIATRPDEEVIELLSSEWESRESKCIAVAESWEEDLRSFGRDLSRIRDAAAEESRSLEDSQSAVELHRLQGQYQMATKSVQRAVDVNARAERPSEVAKLLTKAPVYFHSNPDKFRRLVQILKESWKS